MSAPLEVAADEHGVVRVFALNLDDAAAKPWRQGEAPAMAAALGIQILDPDFVDVLRLKELKPMTLSAYLTEGIGLPAEMVAQDKTRLDALSGHAVVILSRAFGGNETALRPSEAITLIATYNEPPAMPSFEDLSSDAAKGSLPTDDGPETPPFRASKTWALLVALGLIVILVLALFLFYV